MSKICSKCKEMKEFYSINDTWCKECHKEYRTLHADRINKKSKECKEKRKEHYSNLKKEWNKNNKELKRLYSLNYLASKQNRQPIWFDEFDKFVMKEAHHLAKEREKMTGFKWHVDHVIPLNGKKISGLHTYTNIQVIPAHINVRKHNKYEVQ